MEDCSFEANDFGDEKGEVSNADFLAGADIDDIGLIVGVHEEDAGIGHVIDVEELAQGVSGAPHDDFGGVGNPCIVEAAEERREDVGVSEVEVVTGAVEVGGHDADGVEAVLAAIGLGHLDSGDLGDGVGLVGGLERAGEEVILAHGLRGVPGVDAGGTEEEELAGAGAPGGID